MKKSIQQLFISLPKRFKPEKALDYKGIFHFILQENPSSIFKFTVSVEEGICRMAEGLKGTAISIIKSDAQIYLDLEMGLITPSEAFGSGKIEVSNIEEMLKFTKLFRPYFADDVPSSGPKGTPRRSPDSGPLLGLKILDFTRLLPGPLATLLMADMGAEVIKVESPSFYDYTRDMPPMQNGESMAYLALNRSKRSLCLDYTQEEGKALVIELIRESDVLIEQFRPGVMQKMGLDYKEVKKINPRLIYVSITGYGQTGPYAHLAGHDLNYITLAGVLAGNTNEAPQMPLIQMADIAGGSYMAMIAILSALHSRERTGEGQFVDVAMMDGVFPLTINALLTEWAMGKPSAREEKMLSGALLNYNIYPSKDGRYIALGTLEPKFWNRFCAAIQKPNWKSRMFEQDPAKLNDYKEDLKTLFMSQDAAYWHKFGLEQDLLINVVREVSELEEDPQIKARKMISEMEHSKAGTVKSIGQPLKFSKTPSQAFWPAPLLGEDSLALLQEMGVSQARIQEMIEKGVLKCQSPEAK